MTTSLPMFPPPAGSQNRFSRRGLLSRAAAAGASAAVLGAAGAAVAATALDPVYAAIERHRTSETAFAAADAEWQRFRDSLPEDVTRDPETILPLHLTPDLDPENLPADMMVRHCRSEAEIYSAIATWRTLVSSRNRKKLVDGAIADLEADRASLAARRAACGLTAMQDRRDEAWEATEDTAYAILDFPPTTLAGAAALLAYAAEVAANIGDWPIEVGEDERGDWNERMHRMLADVLRDIAAGGAAPVAGRAS